MNPSTLIIKLVNQFIGVSGGYLGLPERFTYRTHFDFYAEYCDLAKNTNDYPNMTTRECFIAVFNDSGPKDQAKILRGSIERFPVGQSGAPSTRTKDLEAFFLDEADKLEKAGSIADPNIAFTSDVVLEALEDAKALVRERKAVSAVDRVHTAFHGYLRSICTQAGIAFIEGDGLAVLLKKIFTSHSKFQSLVGGGDIANMAKGLGSISTSLNPIRNTGSLAHANEKLIEEPEAMFVVNSVKTLITYLEGRLAK